MKAARPVRRAGQGNGPIRKNDTAPWARPNWYVLDDRGFEPKLVNAQHLMILRGRKSDDAAGIPELLEHGMLSGSFLPPTVSASCGT